MLMPARTSHRSDLNRRPLVTRSVASDSETVQDNDLADAKALNAPENQPNRTPRSVPEVSALPLNGADVSRGTFGVEQPHRFAGEPSC